VEAVLWDSIIKGVQRRGASTPAIQALFERVMRSLGSKVSWSRLAREMDVPLGPARRRGSKGPDPRTLQSYVEFLAINYFALIVYFWKPDSGSGELTKDKKIYFGDPLLCTITAERLGMQRNPHAEVENAVALALYRCYEPTDRSAENMVAPEHVHVWGTRRGGEIDFVCGPRSKPRRLRSPTGGSSTVRRRPPRRVPSPVVHPWSRLATSWISAARRTWCPPPSCSGRCRADSRG
jgi:predicted AAA+ superfamily ATPase